LSVLYPFYYECRFPRPPANFALQNNFFLKIEVHMNILTPFGGL